MDVLENEECPVCHSKTLTLTEDTQDIPYFGKCYIFSVSCSNCKYHQADVEAEEQKDPCKLEFEATTKEDLNVRVVKSSEATVKMPTLRMSVEPGVGSEGFITNIEGLLQRFKKVLEDRRNSAEDPDIKKKAKNLLKKIWKIECGEEKLKIIIEDPSGNSAIISDKTIVTKIKKKN